jgi:hypothetical protein
VAVIRFGKCSVRGTTSYDVLVAVLLTESSPIDMWIERLRADASLSVVGMLYGVKRPFIYDVPNLFTSFWIVGCADLRDTNFCATEVGDVVLTALGGFCLLISGCRKP